MTPIDHPYEAQSSGFDFHIPDDVLLSARACDIGVRLENTLCKKLQTKLYAELARAGISKLRPKFYLGDEWFCPDGSASIAIPFWLAHPRLEQLEKTKIGFVEGAKEKEFMQLLRHEMGHCFEHAYKLSRRTDWKIIFGDPRIPYEPDHYKWTKGSKDYVLHLPNGYAQAHPEEDFAETFAVWLDPKSNWRSKYKSWPHVLKKLNFINLLVSEFGGKNPRNLSYKMISKIDRSRRTLGQIYGSRLKNLLH